MSMTLNLIDRLLTRGRNLQRLGQNQEALRVFRRLTGLRELPAEVAEETQCRMGELQIRRRRYPKARRHLTAALRYRPDCSYYYHLLARASDAEDTGNPRRAAKHYRRSLQLDPNQPQCLMDYGLFNLREGRTEAGLTCLRRAAELAPEDAETVNHLVTGLTTAGRSREAQAILRSALFQNPRDARFRKLWNDFHFDRLFCEQMKARRDTTEVKPDEEPVLLPFAQAGRGSGLERIDSRTVRQDGPTPVPAPHGSQPARRSDRRHAQ